MDSEIKTEVGPPQAPHSRAGAPQLTRVLSQKEKAPLETTAAVGVMPTREKKLQFVSKEQEDESQRLRAMIENLLHLSPYAMCITDMQKEDEPIVYANECFCTWTEYPEDFIVGRNCRFLQGPKTDRAVVVAMRDAINTGSEFRGMVTNYSRTGTLLYNNLVMTPVKNRDGTVTHYTGIQNFSLDPPNIDNTPKAPLEVAFNPLAQHIALWQESHTKGAGPKEALMVDTNELLQEMAQEAAHAATSSSPKSPKSPKSAKSSPLRKSPDSKAGSSGKSKFSDSPYAVPLVASPKGSGSSSHAPAAKRAPKEMSSVPEMGPSKYMKPVNLNADAFQPGTISARAGRPGSSRRSMSRRQGGACAVTPDGDVWMELLLRSLNPNSVPMLPNQPAAVPSKSRAMTYDDFETAKKERIAADVAVQPAAVDVM
ncbi:PYP-like sensor domain (PAS domain) containing protein [Klebsormidium nitens]|uniref:PYP-like sensor domain (PAS domain) containing protein n=1 Tax=Klebsormidium nitens TaxID=105231 RepID=A0A1Y1I4K8_KLENI|nr:PYP-like sensor domain (PAS domain) containing protein [Klebsormidium nitens]|eukprot:GAQ84101.1 PYP-like sensor domain (PAS domain) containing protein [Klebsormidium nitens]